MLAAVQHAAGRVDVASLDLAGQLGGRQIEFGEACLGDVDEDTLLLNAEQFDLLGAFDTVQGGADVLGDLLLIGLGKVVGGQRRGDDRDIAEVIVDDRVLGALGSFGVAASTFLRNSSQICSRLK